MIRLTLIVCALAGCIACGSGDEPAPTPAPPAAPAPELLPVDHPNPDDFKPEIAASLRPALARFESSAATLNGASLGAAYGKLGLHYQAHQQQEAGAACFTNAMRLDPKDHRWPYHLAVHDEETGDFELAIKHYRQSLALEPNNLAANTRLGLLVLQLGELDNAKTELEKVTAREPDNAAALAGLADIAAEQGQTEQAVDLYRRALTIDPLASQLQYRLGLSYRKLGDIENARAALSKRGERIPRIADPLLVIMQAHLHPTTYYLDQADTALNDNDLRRAAQLLSLALTVEPTHADALTQLGELLLAVNRNSAARERFEQLVAAHPDNALGHYYLGLCAVRARDRDNAIRHMREALRLEPGMERATRAMQRLNAGQDPPS